MSITERVSFFVSRIGRTPAVRPSVSVNFHVNWAKIDWLLLTA